MNLAGSLFNPQSKQNAAKIMATALGFFQAEKSLQAVAGGQLDAVIDPDGKPYLLRPAQEELRQNETRLQTLLDCGPGLVAEVARDGVIRWESPAMQRLVGFASVEMVGRKLVDFIHDEDWTRLSSACDRVLTLGGTEPAVEFRHRTPDGGYRRLEATVSALRSAGGASVVLACLDPDERQKESAEAAQREAALAQEVQARDRFFAMLAHELRTPLTPALLGIQTLEEDERFEAARPVLAMVRRNIELQARLLENLFDFSQVVHGKLQPKLEAVDAHAAVRSAVAICQSELNAHQIALSLELKASEDHVAAGPTEFQQILWILLKNAVKFSEQRGAIEISSTNPTPGEIEIEVIDHGVGIAAATLPLVFNAFQQGDRAAQQRHGGLGLGLFIAKGLATAQGGTLTVASEGQGKGATFRLIFETVSPTEPPASQLPPPDAAPLRILLVEDHAETRDVLVRLLERRGHTVLTAQDMATALRMADNYTFELLISDIGLPDGTGYDLMRQLRLGHPALAAIAMSGYGMPLDREQSAAAGFAEHLVKPIDFTNLEAALQRTRPSPPNLTASSEAASPRSAKMRPPRRQIPTPSFNNGEAKDNEGQR